MTSVYINVGSNLAELQHQIQRMGSISPPIDGICLRITDQIWAIVREFRYLTLIENCIHKWTEAEAVVRHLASQLEAIVQEIASQVKQEEFQKFKKGLQGIADGRPSIFFRRTKFQKKASKMIDVLDNLIDKINLLKPEIRDACKNLMDQQFQSRSPMDDFVDWKEFVKLIDSCLGRLQDEYVNHGGWDKLADLRNHLQILQLFLDGLPHIPRARDFSIQVANVAIRAALVSCEGWASHFDPNMKEDVIIALSDLQRKIDFTLPEPLDQLLRLLKAVRQITYGISNEKAVEFVQYVLPFNRSFEKVTGKDFRQAENLLPFDLTKEIESLTISFLDYMPDKDEGSFLLDFKLLISEIEESFDCSLGPENGSLLLNLFAKVSLLKIEVFIVRQVDSYDRFLLYSHERNDALNQWVQKIKESPEDRSDNVNQILVLMEAAAKLVASLHDSLYYTKDITRNTVRTMLCLLRLNILHWKLDRKLYDNNESLLLIVKDRAQSFLEGLKFLTNCFTDQQGSIVKDGTLELARMKAMVGNVISLYHSLHTQNITEEMIENMILMLSDLQDEIKFIMSDLREMYVPNPGSNFPKTNAFRFFDALLTKLRELLLNYKAKFFVSVKQHVEEILAVVEFFSHCLSDILELAEEEVQELGNLGGHVIDVAYEVEYLVDSIVAGDKSECHYLIWLYDLLQNSRQIKMQVTKVEERKTYEVKVHNVPQISRHVIARTSTPRIDDTVMCLNDQEEMIIARLVGGYPKRDIVSIVGMPGVGKTTLAKKVYSNPTVATFRHGVVLLKFIEKRNCCLRF